MGPGAKMKIIPGAEDNNSKHKYSPEELGE